MVMVVIMKVLVVRDGKQFIIIIMIPKKSDNVCS